MAILAISDLHLPGRRSIETLVRRFGEAYRDHPNVLAANWRAAVQSEDTVLVAGDTCWGDTFRRAEEDLRLLDSLPGRKLLIQGNHDAWWQKVVRMKTAAPSIFPTLDFLEPGEICELEDGSLLLAVGRFWSQAERDLGKLPRERPKTVLMHYPPNRDFFRLFAEHGARTCVFGHLHRDAAESWQEPNERMIDGVRYVFGAGDALGWRLTRVG